MWVGSLHRHPIKSMLGEAVDSLFVDSGGAAGDRRLALVDVLSGRVASAKQPRLWRLLLQCTATLVSGRVDIRLPDGTRIDADRPDIDERLSELIGRAVRLVDKRPLGAALERPDPEKLLELGIDADVSAPVLELATATPGDSFVDVAPVHAITTATLQRVNVAALRYRPNLVIATPPGYPPYTESEWIGQEMTAGEARLRVFMSTWRCVVPTLQHGPLPRAPQSLRTLIAENRLAAPGLDKRLPCAGVYLEVIGEGTIRVGDPVALDRAGSAGDTTALQAG